MATLIPPWLNIDPIEPARLKLQANNQRRQMEAAELTAQIARERMQADALQHAASLAQKQQEASDLAAYREEESERKRSEGAALERLRQQKYEQDAMEASIRMEGMRDYESSIASGEAPAMAFSRNAHKLLFKNPPALERFVQNLGEQGSLAEQRTEGGAAYLARPGGRPYFVPRTSLPGSDFTPSLVDVGPGVSGVRTGPNRFQVIEQGRLSDIDKARLSDIAHQEAYYRKGLGAADDETIAEQPHLKRFQDYLEDLRQEREAILESARPKKKEQEQEQELPLVTSQAQYDALPAKSYYRRKDGGTSYKP